MKKYINDFEIVENRHFNNNYSLLILSPADGSKLPEIAPGQFVEVTVKDADILLRRPISVCNVDYEANTLWLLVRNAGRGTAAMIAMKEGDTLNLVYPLGNGFSIASADKRVLLIGGGVGVAPLLYLAKKLNGAGAECDILLGARTADDLLLRAEFARYCELLLSTEHGPAPDHQGLVTTHPVMKEKFDLICCCGPAPMMKAVAAIAKENATDCEVSLENMMACGLGACLCCVEKTVKGNVCVCSEGPVFNINQLTW